MALFPFWSFEHLYFEFVSDLETCPERSRWIRISDFKLPDNSLPNMMLQSTTNYELLATVFVSLQLSRILYKSPLFFAKQTQFAGCTNKHNLSNNNELYQWTTNHELWTNYENKPKQTQFSDDRILPWACRRGLPWATWGERSRKSRTKSKGRIRA